MAGRGAIGAACPNNLRATRRGAGSGGVAALSAQRRSSSSYVTAVPIP